ncbi:MAG: hypothetical protein F4X36_08725 [Gammaproteobacteria bacterium]|nr:hypothetical protein [Gammaproteobacteria bacterium]
METISASVESHDNKHFIVVRDGDMEIVIPMSENKPKKVKSAFNKVILRIKSGEFQIKLEEVGDDLLSQVANEYIKQVNREIREIHGQMKDYGLVLE